MPDDSRETMADDDGVRWLVLSLIWTRGSESLVWYNPGAAGYVIDINLAGRFTEAEARSYEVGGQAIAVPELAMLAERTITTIQASMSTIDRLTKAGARPKGRGSKASA